MLSIKRRPRGAIVSIAAMIALLGLSAAPAGADTITEYPPEAEARNFAAGQGGWSKSESFESCLELPPPLNTCPTVDNTFQAAGGAGNDGHIRSSFEATLAIVGTATATWQSDEFTYSGAGGEAPASVSLGLSRRADVADLLQGITGSSATYSIALIDETAGGTVIPVTGPTSLAGAAEWGPVAPVPVNPGLLTPGNAYAIRISSTYVPGLVGVGVSGSADYDNVVLSAARPDDPDPPVDPPTDPGDDGKDGGDGKDDSSSKSTSKNSSSSDQATTQQGTTTGVIQNGRRVLVRLSCPARAKKSCRITAQGKLAGKSVTKRRTVKVAKGKSRIVSLPVKPRFREIVVGQKRLLIVQKVKAGKKTRTFTRSRPLIQRG